MFKLWSLIVALMVLSSNAEESTELTCRFAMQYSGVFTAYSCILEEINVKNTSEPIVIKGVHLPGKSNIDVKLLVIVYSNTSSIITQLFEQFPNVYGYIATAAGIQEIKPFVFKSTSYIRQVQLTYNNLGAIRSNAFYGIKNVEVIGLDSNNIVSIDEDVFEGLYKLELLSLKFNSIKTLGPNIFKSLVKIELLNLNFNGLETIDGKWIENKPFLEVLNLQGNNATAVDPALIDNITNLQILSMPNNICVNRIFFIQQEKLSLDYLRQELKQCFENFRQDKPKTLTKLILEVEGHLTLYNENGTAILRV
ncbi:unnamed protein product [Diamesa tonsa]